MRPGRAVVRETADRRRKAGLPIRPALGEASLIWASRLLPLGSSGVRQKFVELVFIVSRLIRIA